MITYGQIIRWTTFKGTHHEIIFDGCPSIESAKREAIRFAKSLQWPGALPEKPLN